MNFPVLVLFLLCILPILCSIVTGYYRHKQLGVIDNKHPRQQNALLTGAGARAFAAQQNAWEALAVYIAALLAVNIAAVPVEQYASLVMVLFVLRLAHAVFYIINQDILRSIVFSGAYGICIYMFILAL